MEYLNIPEARLREAIEYIFHRVLHIGAVYSLESAEILHDVLEACERRREYVQELITALSGPVLLGPASERRSFLAYLLGIRYSGYRTRRLAPYVMQHIWRVFSEARDSTREDQWQRACVDVHEARLYVYIYREKIVELYGIFGLSLVFTPFSPLLPIEIYRLPFFILAEGLRVSSGRQGPRFSELELSKNQASSLIKSISDDLLSLDKIGEVDTAIFSGTDDMRRVFASELLHYLDYIAKRTRLRGTDFVSRCVYVFILMFLEQSRSALPSEPRDDKLRVTAKKSLLDIISVIREDEFSAASLKMLNAMAD